MEKILNPSALTVAKEGDFFKNVKEGFLNQLPPKGLCQNYEAYLKSLKTGYAQAFYTPTRTVACFNLFGHDFFPSVQVNPAAQTFNQGAQDLIKELVEEIGRRKK